METITSAPWCANSSIGIARVTPPLPKLLVVPGVFANRDRHFLRLEAAELLDACRVGIARFVENVVIRQQHLDLAVYDTPAVDHRSGVLRPDDRIFGRTRHVSENQRHIQVRTRFHDGIQHVCRAVEKRVLLH